MCITSRPMPGSRPPIQRDGRLPAQPERGAPDPEPAPLSQQPGPPAVVAPLVAELIRHPNHQFWPDSLSLLTLSGVDPSRLLEAGQVTDTYLLALAVHQGGTLVSFDRRLASSAVAGGHAALRLIES